MKLNKLLPIVALTGIAAVAMPLVACSTNGGGQDDPQPEPVEYIELTNEGAVMSAYIYIQSEVMSVQAGVEYTIKIDMSQWQSFVQIGDPYNDWMFGFVKTLETEDLPITEGANIDETSNLINVYLNNDEEIAIDSKEAGGDLTSLNCVEINEKDITASDVVTATLVFKDSFENGRFFMIWAS